VYGDIIGKPPDCSITNCTASLSSTGISCLAFRNACASNAGVLTQPCLKIAETRAPALTEIPESVKRTRHKVDLSRGYVDPHGSRGIRPGRTSENGCATSRVDRSSGSCSHVVVLLYGLVLAFVYINVRLGGRAAGYSLRDSLAARRSCATMLSALADRKTL